MENAVNNAIPSLQSQFDKMALHLLTQDQKSRDDTGGCVYRGDDGLMCAVGALIKESAYAPNMEGDAVIDFKVAVALLNSGEFTEEDVCSCSEESAGLSPRVAMFNRIQDVHDTCDAGTWPDALRKVAGEFSLNATAIDSFRKGA